MGGNPVRTRTAELTAPQMRVLQIVSGGSWEGGGGISPDSVGNAFGNQAGARALLSQLEGMGLVAWDHREGMRTYGNYHITQQGYLEETRHRKRLEGEIVAKLVPPNISQKLAANPALTKALIAGMPSLSVDDVAELHAALRP